MGEAEAAAAAAGSKLFLQVQYFRYFSFLPDGRVYFVRSTRQPQELVDLFGRLRGSCREGGDDDTARIEQIRKEECGSKHLESTLTIYRGRWKTKRHPKRGDVVAVRITQGGLFIAHMSIYGNNH